MLKIIQRCCFIFLTLSFILHCEDSYKHVFEKNRESGETIRLYKFSRQAVDEDGITEWLMDAEEAYIFLEKDKESRIIAYNFNFNQFRKEGTVQTTMSAGRGEIDYTGQKVHLTQGVTFHESDKRYAKGSSMDYDFATKIITSDEKVEIFEEGRKTTCIKGIEIDRENEREVCKGPNIIHKQTEGSEQKVNDIFD